MVYLFLGLVALSPAFVASIARLFWPRGHPFTLAITVAIPLLVFTYWIHPDKFTMIYGSTMDTGFSVPMAIGLFGFILTIQIAIIAAVARLGIAVIDRIRRQKMSN
jgi:hypothetical protein